MSSDPLCVFTDIVFHASADMYRSLWRFGVFNAVQSSCFETVSLPSLPTFDELPLSCLLPSLFPLLRRLRTSATDVFSAQLAATEFISPTRTLLSQLLQAQEKQSFSSLRSFELFRLPPRMKTPKFSTWRLRKVFAKSELKIGRISLRHSGLVGALLNSQEILRAEKQVWAV